MAILPILVAPDPGLRRVALPVGAVDDPVRSIVADLFDTMYDARGIGLAATQVAIERRIVVIDLQEGDDDSTDPPPRDPRVFVDPELLWVSDDRTTYNEGCLSIPEQYAEVERPAECRVAWTDEQGDRHEAMFGGLLATCLQHEIDHLDGILFIDHLSRLKRDIILKKLAKARKAG